MSDAPRQAGDPVAGERIRGWELERFLGEGAMGVVWLAHDAAGAPVAIKLLRKTLSGDDVYRKRFLREARVASEVSHPNLVAVREAGSIAGRDYLASDFVDGRTLAEHLRAEGPLPPEEAVRLVGEIAAGLDALHRVNLVHRDVKPSNVLLDRAGKAALTDFGLATGRAYTVLTRPGQVVGTVDYLAPELIQGDSAGPASDIYALGCVAFACLAGQPPFAGRRAFQVTVAHLGEDPADPCEGRSDCPPGLGPAALSALAKDPSERPRSARGYALDLLRAIAR